MPNYVMNRVHLSGEQSRINALLDAVRCDGGELVEENWPEPCSKEAFELAADVWGGTVEEFGFRLNENTGNYEYFDGENTYVPEVSDG